VKQGRQMMSLAKSMWPIGRSLSGQGVRDTLKLLKDQLPNLEIKSFFSGERCSDWTIPNEWNVKKAYIVDPSGRKICDYSVNNLHLVGYSTPIEGLFDLKDLQPHLYSLKDQPTAVPYVTSYYKEQWGFCLRHDERENLREGVYKVVIDSTLEPGKLDYGELIVKGSSDREILFSTYICHPSMANNEISGPVLATELAKFVSKLDNHYSYRFLFVPETIGTIAYISKNFESLKSNLLAGYVLTCVGDERTYSYVPSRQGGTVADKIAMEVLEKLGIEYKRYSWKDRGSDERQYCAPGVDLPVCSVMRSKYGEFPEYHTSLDTLEEVVTSRGLQQSFDFYSSLINHLETLRYPKINTIGEPQLGRRGLYPNTSIKGVYSGVNVLMDVISGMDGTSSLQEISKIAGTNYEFVADTCLTLEREGLVTL